MPPVECLDWILAQLGEILDGTDHLAGVGVLVVVPGDDLNLRIAVGKRQDHGLRGIEQGAEAHADDVGGDDGSRRTRWLPPSSVR